MKDFKYTFVIIVTDEEKIEKTIESIQKQKYDLNKVELILEDLTNQSSLKEYVSMLSYPSIILNQSKNTNHAKRYQHGLGIARGEYITFINSDMYYEENNLLSKLDKLFSLSDIITVNLGYYDSDTEKRKRYKMEPKGIRLIDLRKEYARLHLGFEGYFVKKSKLKRFQFNTKINDDFRYQFIIELLKNNKEFYYAGHLHLTSTTPFEDNTSKNSIQYQKSWYKESLDKFLLPTLKGFNGHIPLYIQELAMYLIYSKFNCNIYDRDKNVLDKDEFLKFNNSVTKVLLLLNDEIIVQPKEDSDDFAPSAKHQFKTQRWLKFWMYENKINELKVTKNIYINQHENVVAEYKNKRNFTTIIGESCNESINVFAINYKNGKLYFDCTTSLRDYMLAEDINIEILYNGKKIEIRRNEFYTLLKAFGTTLSRKYAFSFAIDALENVKNQLEAYATINGTRIRLNFKYNKVQAHLSNSRRAFWHYKDFILENKRTSIVIRKYNPLRLLKDEIFFDLSKLKNVKNKKRACKLIFLRMLYYITKPYYKNKHIWLTWDKLYKAGDNGEYIYQYGIKHGKNIYYIIKKDSLDYKRLVKQNPKHIIVFNSLKAKLFSLHAEVILATHANVISYCGFDGISKHFACGLFNPEIIEIQHGLTIQQIAQFQNRLFDNIKHYCCASQYEVDNILHELYDFDKSQITLTGLARYDGLKSKDKKIILITPTWRRNVVNSSVAHIKKKHNDNFKNSEYFRIYNNLINNKKLIDKANETGYKIIYLLHPAMSGQLDDFAKNEFVDIIPATGDMNYEKILTESSLMVTDYSGVQFDFAYQRKVLLYYHPKTLPPHYEAGGLKYDSMGFGPICKDEESIVHELCYYMDNGCQIQEKYKKRADDFFAFSDFNNCKRIIETVDKYLADIEE